MSIHVVPALRCLYRCCYVVGVILSAARNPNNFANFTQAVDFFTYDTPGNFCFPVDLSVKNISGVQDGANVTVQLVYDAGDGRLYQVRFS